MSGIGIRCRHKRAKHNSGTHSKDQGFAHISLLLFPPSKLPSLVGKTRKRERLICCQSVSQHARQTRQAACLPCNTLGIRSDAAIGSRTTVLSLGLPSHANGIPTRSPPQNLGGLSPDSCRGRSMASTEATGHNRTPRALAIGRASALEARHRERAWRAMFAKSIGSPGWDRGRRSALMSRKRIARRFGGRIHTSVKVNHGRQPIARSAFQAVIPVSQVLS